MNLKDLKALAQATYEQAPVDQRLMKLAIGCLKLIQLKESIEKKNMIALAAVDDYAEALRELNL